MKANKQVTPDSTGIAPQGSRGPGFKDSSEMLKNYKKQETGDVERMLKALIKSLENKPLDPGTLESSNPSSSTILEKNQ